MIDLHKILGTLYADKKHDEVKHKLDKHGFYILLQRSVILLNKSLADEKNILEHGQIKSIQVGHIASLLLSGVNQRLITIGNIKEKEDYEELLSTICRGILKSFLELTVSDKLILSYQVLVSLQDTCRFHDYDFEKLKSFIWIESDVLEMESRKHKTNVVIPKPDQYTDKIPHYKWKGKPVKREEFLQLVSEITGCKKKDINKLFSEPTAKLDLTFTQSEADIILHFFSAVKGKYVSFHNTNGYYKVLTYHVLYFEEKFLTGVSPQERINRIKNNKARYNENKQKIEKWLEHFIQ
jgi:hypothetical protein